MHQYILNELLVRLQEARKFIQVLTGPRQVGKTTLALQILKKLNVPSHYATADEPGLKGIGWIQQQWELLRIKLKKSKDTAAILILDEVQNLSQWSEIVKRLWDEDTRNNINIKVLLLGSSPLLMQQGLTETLAGRFEVVPITHWSYKDMQTVFGWDLSKYIFYGGYPGAVELIENFQRWKNYIQNSLIETTISRDILLMTRVNKPALLRQLFNLSCEYSSQILSYQKMLGPLQEAGNTTTLTNYLKLLSDAGMVCGLGKYTKSLTKRNSSPKLQVYNTALITANQSLPIYEYQENSQMWGRLVESAVASHLLNSNISNRYKLYYWRNNNLEVDFVIKYKDRLLAIEVKSSADTNWHSGVEEFTKHFQEAKLLLIGIGGLTFEEFFTIDPVELV